MILPKIVEELKSLLPRVKVSEKTELKLNIKKKKKTQQDHGIWSHHFMANRKGKSGSSDRFYFLGLPPKSPWMVTVTVRLKDACSLEGKL